LFSNLEEGGGEGGGGGEGCCRSLEGDQYALLLIGLRGRFAAMMLKSLRRKTQGGEDS